MAATRHPLSPPLPHAPSPKKAGRTYVAELELGISSSSTRQCRVTCRVCIDVVISCDIILPWIIVITVISWIILLLLSRVFCFDQGYIAVYKSYQG